jgi:hypothetical protein
MALKKPAFETTAPDFAADAAPATSTVETPTKPAAAEASAKVEATTAIAKAATGAVATVNEDVKRFQEEFDAMRGAMDTSYGNFKIFKATDGEIRESGNNTNLSLGRYATVRLLSWDFHWQVTPGTDGAKSKDFVAFSSDGETIESVIGEDMRHYVGSSINDYLSYLRTEGFDKAESKRYLNTVCAVLASESGKHEPGMLVQIVFSPSSVSSFNSYQEKLKGVARGVQLGLPGFTMPSDPFTLTFRTESAAKGSNRWTRLTVEPAKA